MGCKNRLKIILICIQSFELLIKAMMCILQTCWDDLIVWDWEVWFEVLVSNVSGLASVQMVESELVEDTVNTDQIPFKLFEYSGCSY